MNKFESYDYLKVTVEETRLSHYIDGYECFGWKLEPNIPLEVNGAKAVVHFKRSRAILNKVELTRLQSHFEACQRDLEALEGSAVSLATSAGIGAGILGCAFVAGAVFAVTA